MSRLIYRTSQPHLVGAPVLPMTEHDRVWCHTAAREKQKERKL